MSIAIIIPTQNEAQFIGPLIGRLRDACAEARVVVADCNSSDATVACGREAGAMVIDDQALTSRAEAMQAGANAAMERWPEVRTLWFVHADCIPPENWPTLIHQALADPHIVAGAFGQRFYVSQCTEFQRMRLQFVCFWNRLRYRHTGIYFGDQGLFVRSQALAQIGGVPQVGLLEDAELCRRLRRLGPMALLPQRMSASPRRFLHHGIITQMVYDSLILTASKLGLCTHRIHHWYQREKG